MSSSSPASTSIVMIPISASSGFVPLLNSILPPSFKPAISAIASSFSSLLFMSLIKSRAYAPIASGSGISLPSISYSLSYLSIFFINNSSKFFNLSSIFFSSYFSKKDISSYSLSPIFFTNSPASVTTSSPLS